MLSVSLKHSNLETYVLSNFPHLANWLQAALADPCGVPTWHPKEVTAILSNTCDKWSKTDKELATTTPEHKKQVQSILAGMFVKRGSKTAIMK